MAFNAQDYFDGARERVIEARECYGMQQYAAAHYLAGLAVECLLRAYRLQKDTQFDARHDLNRLRKRPSFYDFVSSGRIVEVSSALADVTARWSNDDRYRSREALRRKLKRANLDRGIKGDYLKEDCRVIVGAAIVIVTEGSKKWKT